MRRVILLTIFTFCLVNSSNVKQSGETSLSGFTPTAQGSSSTDVIIDGPWASQPNDLEPELSWDQETEAITMQTNPTDLVFVAQPDSKKDAFTNNIYTMGKFDGRIYLGYGDLYNNQGPVDLVSYNPLTGTLLQEMENIPQEQLANWRIGESGQFYVSGEDSREPWAFGSYYVNNGFGWRKIRTIYRGLHVKEMMEFKGRLYTAFSSDNQQIVNYPFILISSNGGLTWQYEKLEEDVSQDCAISKLVLVHATTGDELFVMAYIINPPARPEKRIYRFDGQFWQRMTFGRSSDEFMLQNIYAFQEHLLITYYVKDSQNDSWIIAAYNWDGQAQTEIPYLKGRNLDFSLFTEQDGWLYALIPPAGFSSNITSYTFVRTQDLINWEELGNVLLPEGVIPGALTYLHNRLYLGGRIAWQGIEGNPPVYTLVQTVTDPLANARLNWDADIPEGASLSFQIKAGKDYTDFSTAQFLGPDGTMTSYYKTSGITLPSQQTGATIFTIQMKRTANTSGKKPFVRTVTVQSDKSSTTYAVDDGSGLYTASNTAGNGQYTSEIFGLELPLADGSLFFNAHTPDSTGVTFQVRSGVSRDELAKASFNGPDGSSESFYTNSGTPFWKGHNGHLFIQYRAILSSTNPAVAPFLRQVILVNRDGILDHFEVKVGETQPWIAGELYAIQINVLNKNGEILPLNGELQLSVTNSDDNSFVSPKSIQLINGSGNADVSLFKALPSQICGEIAKVSGCSEEIEVRSGQAARLKIEAPDLYTPDQNISPHAEVNKPFAIVVRAYDDYDNLVKDYAGSVHCESWKWEALDPLIVPSYTFTAEDAGTRQFNSAVSFSNPGEYSLVCLDDANPQIGGTLAITVGEFDQSLFP